MDASLKKNLVFDRLRGPDPAAGDGCSEMLPASDGVKMFLQYWIPGNGADKAVVCFHGAGGHGQYFSLIADALVPEGIAVFVADYRGHGLSEGARGDYPSFARLLEDCHDVEKRARQLLPGAKIYIFGESMGGAMAVNYAAAHNSEISGLILFAPALQFRKSIPWPQILYLPYYLAAAVVSPGSPVIDMTGNEEKGIKNPVHVEYDKTDPHHLIKISARYFLQLNKYAAIGLKNCPEKITAPVILFQGGADPAIDPAGARSFVDRLAASDKELVFYPKGLHVLLTDPDAPDVAARLVNWMNAH